MNSELSSPLSIPVSVIAISEYSHAEYLAIWNLSSACSDNNIDNMSSQSMLHDEASECPMRRRG